MTEENKENAVFSNEAPKESVPEVENVQVKSEKEPNHERKTSNLKGRCKRSNSAVGMATIKEDNSKLPKEIKTIKLDSVERIERQEKSNVRKDENSKRCEAEKSCKCEKSCCCCSFLGKIKNFILRLFGFKTKKNNYGRKNYRGHRYNHQKRRNNYRSSRNQSR